MKDRCEVALTNCSSCNSRMLTRTDGIGICADCEDELMYNTEWVNDRD